MLSSTRSSRFGWLTATVASLLLGIGLAARAASADTSSTAQQPPLVSRFCNTASMIIPDYGPANPYPSNIGVSGLSGTVSDVTVDVYGLGHDFFGDIDMALVGPHGAGSQAVLLMSDASEVCARTGINLTFADGAPPMPESGCPQSGSMYKPSNYAKSLGTDDFPLPAPQGVFRYGTTLSTFDGTEPNGAWSLYVVDDYPMFHGAMTGGWCLNITTSAAKP